MPKRFPYLLISDMIQSIEELKTFTEGMSYEDFIEDIKTFRAVLASTLILGEAVRSLDDATVQLAPQIEWHKIRGIRNRLIHEYFDIDSSILWQVAKFEAPALLFDLQELLQRLKPST
jgi:uncharacterized protein with HEPN domain